MSRILLAVCGIAVLFAIGLWLFARYVESEVDASIATIERQHSQSIVLSETTEILGVVGRRFSAAEPLEVKGRTGEICVLLSRDIDVKDNINGQYRQLLGDAHLKGVLHARGGKNYTWNYGGWRAPYASAEGRGALLACLELLCNVEQPPKGSALTSIMLSSDRPLRIEGVSWYSSDSMDGVYIPGVGPSTGPKCTGNNYN
ncbi:MAG: hypothetical protein NTV69_07715 [Caldilinea sp.]|nr:hypothetical protein [Caldilinea sp.]